jgi:hypothetical protein
MFFSSESTTDFSTTGWNVNINLKKKERKITFFEKNIEFTIPQSDPLGPIHLNKYSGLVVKSELDKP